MVAEYDYLANEQATVRAFINGSFWTGKSHLPSGSLLSKTYVGNLEVFCQPPVSPGDQCLIDSNRDSFFDRAYTMNATGELEDRKTIHPTPYRISDSTMHEGFKYELVYQGFDENVVQIAYREYTEDLNRPTQWQDLNYTLEGDLTPVSFKDVGLTIHNAKGRQISYTVHTGFKAP